MCVACIVAHPRPRVSERFPAVALWDGSSYCEDHLIQRLTADAAEAAQFDGGSDV